MPEEYPYEAYAVAVSCLPEMGPARLLAASRAFDLQRLWGALTAGDESIYPELVTVARAGGRSPDGALEPVVRGWYRAADTTALEQQWQQVSSSRFGVAILGSESYPAALAADFEPPVVLYHDGDIDVLAGARVAIVGTRTCTRYGRDLAAEWAERLSAAGVAIVSGLAEGIDAAAHAGALRGGAPPIAVVGSGLDVVYPRANAGLWTAVAESGVIVAESPLGARPEAWRFPARNRIIAALADVVVVIESHEHGGSLITARDALARGRAVMAVPGAVRSPASVGTNQLLRDGALVATALDDVLAVVGLAGPARPAAERRPPPSPPAQVLLDALGWAPATLNQLAERSALDLATLSLALDELIESRWVGERRGWYERIARDRS